MSLQVELETKWEELMQKATESDEDDYFDPTPAWNKYLEEKGLVTCLHMQFHWGSGGALDTIADLIDIIHSGKQVVIVEDPSAEGGDYLSYLVFPKEVS